MSVVRRSSPFSLPPLAAMRNAANNTNMSTALVSLGSNLGDPTARLNAAVAMLHATPSIHNLCVSSFHRTQPIGGSGEQPPFLNAAAVLETSLSPRELLLELQRTEDALGRVRTTHWGARTIDLDLLLYDREVIDEPELIVPHPFLPFRRFVLEPATEVAPHMVHPILCWAVDDMLRHLKCAPRVFEFFGGSFTERRALGLRVAKQLALPLATWKVMLNDDEVAVRLVLLSGDEKVLAVYQEDKHANDDMLIDTRIPAGLLSLQRDFSPLSKRIDNAIWEALEAPLIKLPRPKAYFYLDQVAGIRITSHRFQIESIALNDDPTLDAPAVPTLLVPADDLDRATKLVTAAIDSMT